MLDVIQQDSDYKKLIQQLKEKVVSARYVGCECRANSTVLGNW